MKESYKIHLQRLYTWIGNQSHIEVLFVHYNDLMRNPMEQTNRVNVFLGNALNLERMLTVVDPNLYRNRSACGAD
ncbi:MAG: sulfotransferase domain-containing protein [Thermoguttaceae bacterium]